MEFFRQKERIQVIKYIYLLKKKKLKQRRRQRLRLGHISENMSQDSGTLLSRDTVKNRARNRTNQQGMSADLGEGEQRTTKGQNPQTSSSDDHDQNRNGQMEVGTRAPKVKPKQDPVMEMLQRIDNRISKIEQKFDMYI